MEDRKSINPRTASLIIAFSLFLFSSNISRKRGTPIINHESIIKLFESSFNDPTFYVPLQCDLNIRKFIDRVRSEGLDVSDLDVIYFYDKGDTLLEPDEARGGGLEWVYHVVIRIKSSNEILDFDYGKGPKVIDFMTYIKVMFPHDLTAGPLLYSALPAHRYLEDYSSFFGAKRFSENVFDLYKFGRVAHFPVKQIDPSLLEWVN